MPRSLVDLTDAVRLLDGVLPRALSADPEASARRIAEERVIPLHGGGEFRVMPGWSDVADLGRTQQRSVHSHAFIGDLVAAYRLSSDARLLGVAMDLLIDWCRTFDYPRDARSMAFHDETVARRLAYWIRLFLVVNGGREGLGSERLWQEISRTAAILGRDEFHAGLNNHGMFQDLALLYFSVCSGGADDLCAKALGRLLTYFESSVCADGVHREHSPSYHFLIARNITVHLPLVRALDPRTADAMARILASMADYAIDIVGPDGRYPPIGDTSPVKIPGNYYATFGAEKGAARPPRRAAFFADGGYAILRDDPAKGTQQTYALLCASHHGSYHKHHDDLSLLLYCGGWIVYESGPFGYQYDLNESKHGYSAAAHSSLIVDRVNPTRGAASRPGLVGIADTADADEVAVANAASRRIEGVLHERCIRLMRSGQRLVVEDRVTADDPRRFTLLWQLAPGVRPVVVGGECHLMRGGEKVAKLVIEATSAVSMTVVRGQNDAVFKALHFPRMGEVQPTAVVKVSAPPRRKWSATTSFILPRRTAKGRLLSMEVAAGNWPIQHHVEEHPDAGMLIFIFPALAPKYTYPVHYKKALGDVRATKVFLMDDFGPQGSYLIASGGELALADAVIGLVETTRTRYGVPRERVVLLGSSKGGASALYFADRLGYGNVVVGAPQTRIGHFLLRQDLANGPTIARYMFPQADAQERLDRLIYDLPVAPAVSRFIHVGRGDHHYRKHVLPYVEHLERAGGAYVLDVGDYQLHKEVGQHFPAFVRRCLEQIASGVHVSQTLASCTS